jgi:hypothetical protein
LACCDCAAWAWGSALLPAAALQAALGRRDGRFLALASSVPARSAGVRRRHLIQMDRALFVERVVSATVMAAEKSDAAEEIGASTMLRSVTSGCSPTRSPTIFGSMI